MLLPNMDECIGVQLKFRGVEERFLIDQSDLFGEYHEHERRTLKHAWAQSGNNSRDITPFLPGFYTSLNFLSYVLHPPPKFQSSGC
jgi:hypothetical protein